MKLALDVRAVVLLALAAACSKTSGPTEDKPTLRSVPQSAPPPSVQPAAPSSTVGTGTGGGSGDGGGALAASNAPPLGVVVVGGPPTTWTPDALAALARFTIHADGADKDAWSLRELAHALVSPKARVTAAIDSGGSRSKIDKKDWADAKKTPVLRINRRGMYKIEWVDKDGSLTNDDDIRDVRSVEVSPGG